MDNAPRSDDTLKRGTRAREDYLEQILSLIEEKGYARVVDIAQNLNIAQASVTGMIQRMDSDGLVSYEKYRGVVLTSEGEKIARAIDYARENKIPIIINNGGQPNPNKDTNGFASNFKSGVHK